MTAAPLNALTVREGWHSPVFRVAPSAPQEIAPGTLDRALNLDPFSLDRRDAGMVQVDPNLFKEFKTGATLAVAELRRVNAARVKPKP